MILLECLLSIIGRFFSPAAELPSAEILFAGDAMQHGPQLEAARSVGGLYSYDDCYEAIDSIISAADFAVVNLETPVGNRTFSGYPCFSAPASYAKALKDAGFDLLLTSNNHSLDRGDSGVRRTLAVLDSLGIAHVGTYMNSKLRQRELPYIEDINGFKVGFLDYTYGTNGIVIREDVVVDYIDRKRIESDIALARGAGAEILCVAMHWGLEYLMLPSAHVKSDAEFLKSRGVDIIVGGHPHVIQPMELSVNPVTGRNCALIYSLGNFISNQQKVDTRGGALAKIVLRRLADGTPYVDTLSYRLVFTVPGRRGVRNFRVYPAESPEIPADMSSLRNNFVQRAENIFDKHNVNISEWR